MGIRSGNFVFLRLSQRGGKTRIGRPGTREKEIGFEREIPEFPKPLAPALRFGSMNPISRLWGHGSVGERRTWWNSAWYLGKKL